MHKFELSGNAFKILSRLEDCISFIAFIVLLSCLISPKSSFKKCYTVISLLRYIYSVIRFFICIDNFTGFDGGAKCFNI